MKLLIVEDERALAEVLHSELIEAGMEADIAADGEEAMTKLRAHKPDLVLLDLLLPKKDGFTVLQEMKNDPKLQDIPTIVISNLGQDEDIKRALSLGAVDFFVKADTPIMEIASRIQKHLASS